MTEARIPVSAVGRIMKRYNGKACVLMVVHEDGVISIASYGKTKKDCSIIGSWAQKIFGVKALTDVPFTTWFGYGNGGVPRALTEAQLATVPESAHAYIAANTHPDAVHPVALDAD